MKLVSLLKVLDKEDRIEVADDNAPITNNVLFKGRAKDCMRKGCIRNGNVVSLCAWHDILLIAVDIEFQKKKGGKKE